MVAVGVVVTGTSADTLTGSRGTVTYYSTAPTEERS